MSALMIRAILSGAKTQTRRAMRPQPPDGWFRESPDEVREPGDGITPRWLVERCPYGEPGDGDRLWVKETIVRVRTVSGVWVASFAADGAPTVIDTWPWKRDVLPSIYLPRLASRITLEIIKVRVQRLHEISENDARAEGVEPVREAVTIYPSRDVRVSSTFDKLSYRPAFMELWDSINGKRVPWSSNPWVWTLTFRRLP